ncbi:MAG: helix-turn-helix domain-containing protein [Clostridia bacterium]
MDREIFLKEKIKERGYNLKDFATKINMPYSTLLSIVNKSVGGAALDNIIKICNGLNISIEDLNPYNCSTEKLIKQT